MGNEKLKVLESAERKYKVFFFLMNSICHISVEINFLRCVGSYKMAKLFLKKN
jgi:hypothetical protein